MKARPTRARRTSAGALAGPADTLVELSRRRLGLGAEVATEHRLERLVMTDRERLIARLVMSAHQQPMRLLIVGLELKELLEGPDRCLRFLPLELECRELFRGRDELPIRFLALPIDPRRAKVREKLAPMDRHGRSEVLDRFARSSAFLSFATAAQRPPEDLEVDVDRDRKSEPVTGVGAHDARGLRRSRRCKRFPQGVQGEVKIRERRCRIGLRPELRDELVSRDRALSIEE